MHKKQRVIPLKHLLLVLHTLVFVQLVIYTNCQVIEESCTKNQADDSAPVCTSTSHNDGDGDGGKNKYSREANEGFINPAQNDQVKQNQEDLLLKLIKDSEDEYLEGRSEDEVLEKLKESKPKCSIYTELIDKDLSYFANGGISQQMINEAKSKGTLYQIRNGKLYRQPECKFPARCEGVEYFLLKIIDKLPKKDLEFVINVSDWPHIHSSSFNLLPVFSFSKDSDYHDITYPAWTFREGGPAISIYPKGIGRWDLLRKSLISESIKIPWDKKEDKGFFRGSRTSQERDQLILLSRENPNLVDAMYTKNQAWKSDADTLGVPAAQEVSFENHCKYKYLFNFRGIAASFRFKHLFLCNSLVLHVGSEWIEFFYPALKPWIHYIPVEKNSTKQDLKDLLNFLKSHEDISKRISERGFQFIKNHLKMSHVTCYWKILLTKYGKLLNYSVQEKSELILINNNSQKS